MGDIVGGSDQPLVPWEVIGAETVLDVSPWFKVTKEKLRLPDGREIHDYYQIQSPSYVQIVAVRPDGRVQGLWQYKHGPRRVSLTLPGGTITAGEEPLAAARRELQEECTLVSDDWICVGNYTVDANRGRACIHIFIAWDCRPGTPQRSDDLEANHPVWLSVEELRNGLIKGDVVTLSAAAAISLALPLLVCGEECKKVVPRYLSP